VPPDTGGELIAVYNADACTWNIGGDKRKTGSLLDVHFRSNSLNMSGEM